MKDDIVSPKRGEAPRPASSTLTIPGKSASQIDDRKDPAYSSLDQINLADMSPAAENRSAPKSRPLPSKRWLAGMIAIIVTVVAAVLGIVWFFVQLSAVDTSSSQMVKIVIEPGTDLAGIATELKKNGLIRNELAFDLYVRIDGKAAELQSGSYRLSPSENVQTIVSHLTSGKTDTFSLTFLPGATLADHRRVLIDAGYDAQVVDAAFAQRYDHPALVSKPAAADLEGYIYGETYNFAADATPRQIITRTLDQFHSVIEENNLTVAYKKQGFTLFEGITMASIIQREVVTAEDAAQVAQVFKLRYDKGMQLGSDVTYQYIADKTGQTRSVDLDSPYNTRRYAGLPPGPIASPGKVALTAVANPAKGDYVYFLSGDDDITYFARTNDEHERNIREHCQKKCQII